MENLELVFYHIPKCAGSSIRLMLYNYFMNKYNENLIYCPDFRNASMHLTFELNSNEIMDNYEYDFTNLKVILHHIRYYNHNTNDIIYRIPKPKYQITFLREPIRRFISHYYFFEYIDKTNIDMYNVHLYTLYENNRSKFNEYIEEYGNLMVKYLGIYELNENGDYDFSNFDRILNDRLNEITFIGKLEHIDEGITGLNTFLNNKFDLSNDLVIEHENKSNLQEDIYEYEKLIPLLLECNKYDILLYNSFNFYIYNE
jgi:hypothetical protein